MLIDSHIHLDMLVKDSGELTELVQTCHSENIQHLIHISTDEQSYLTIAGISAGYSGFISMAMGFPPSMTEHISHSKSKQMLEKKQICAIGEIGLDYFHNYGTRSSQRSLFSTQLEYAGMQGLPVIIHTRDADEDMLDVLKQFRGLEGVIHCFSSGRDFGEAVIELGWHVSFAGNLTYKNSAQIQEAAAALPLERMLVETDAPFLSPIPLRGRKNYPWHVVHTAKFLAELKNLSFEEVCAATAKNTAALFCFKDV